MANILGSIFNRFHGPEEIPAPAIEIGYAVLCMNCERVFDIRDHACPKCGSETYLNIGIALGDEETKARVRAPKARMRVWPFPSRLY